MFKELKKTIGKELKEIMNMMSHQIENIKKRQKIFKKRDQMKLFCIKNYNFQ